MNYIGIRGHRGSGKKTIAYLLGCAIEYTISPNLFPLDRDRSAIFKVWCDKVMDDEYITSHSNLKHIYFSAFKETPELLTELLFGFTGDVTFDDFHKDHTILNLKDFSYTTYDEVPNDLKLYTAEELYNYFISKKEPTAITKDLYASLREVVMYFGREVMQRFFGLNVWVKTLRSCDDRYPYNFNDNLYYKIFTDLKYPSEATYIKEKQGVIVKVNRPGHKKRGVDKLLHDDRIDYELEVGEGLYDLEDKIFEIAEAIIKQNEYVEETN